MDKNKGIGFFYKAGVEEKLGDEFKIFDNGTYLFKLLYFREDAIIIQSAMDVGSSSAPTFYRS